MEIAWVVGGIFGVIVLLGLIAGIRDAIKNPPGRKRSPHGEQPGDTIVNSLTLNRIQGDWRMVSVGRNGNFAPAEVIALSKLTMRVQGDRFSVAGSLGGRLTLRPAANGMELDQISDDGDTHLCLARLRNDELEICQAEVGKPRPKDFEPERRDGASLTRFTAT